MVDSVSPLDRVQGRAQSAHPLRLFELHPEGSLTLPVWVDHVGSRGTRYATGSLMLRNWAEMPPRDRVPIIRPD